MPRCSLLILLALSGSLFAQAPPAQEGPTLTPLWNITADFASPESAYFHAGSNAIYVSSINGQILDKDGNGYISKLSPDGKVVSAKWVTGLNAPKGIRSVATRCGSPTSMKWCRSTSRRGRSQRT